MSTERSQRKSGVAVVEDGVKLRRSLEAMINGHPDFCCAGAFPSAERALEALPSLKPEVVIMDINLPGMSGIACIRRLAELLPDTQLIVLTVYQDTDTIFEAITAGAHGYLIKPVRMEELHSALQYARSGGMPITPAIARKISAALKPGRPAEAPAPDAESEAELAPREREVLDGLIKGFSYKKIAADLDVSYATVCTYANRIFKKLHVHSRAEVAARYMKGGCT